MNLAVSVQSDGDNLRVCVSDLFSFELCVKVKTLIQENTLYSVRLGGIQSSHLTETVI